MKRVLSPFVLSLTAILGGGYAYAAWRLTEPGVVRVALALPFALVWLVPVVYWVFGRENHRRADDLLGDLERTDRLEEQLRSAVFGLEADPRQRALRRGQGRYQAGGPRVLGGRARADYPALRLRAL